MLMKGRRVQRGSGRRGSTGRRSVFASPPELDIPYVIPRNRGVVAREGQVNHDLPFLRGPHAGARSAIEPGWLSPTPECRKGMHTDGHAIHGTDAWLH